MAHTGFGSIFDGTGRSDSRLAQTLAGLVLALLLLCIVLLGVSGLKAVPDLIGMTKAEASEALERAGLALGETAPRASTSQEDGTVLEQSIGAGLRVSSGTRIDIVIADGGATTGDSGESEGGTGSATSDVPGWSGNPPREGYYVAYDSAATPSGVQVPSVMGMSRSAALSALSAAGLKGSVTTANSTTNVPVGTVVAQKPSAGSYQPAGSTIVIYLSSGPPPAGDPYDKPPYE